jgi:hypothetical protein
MLILPLIIALAHVLVLSGCCGESGLHGLTLSDFEFLEYGMSPEEIKDRVGEPTRMYGSGLPRIEYALSDGRTMVLVFDVPNELSDAYVCNEDMDCTNFFEVRN